jgi:hypothetical protein
VRSAALRHGAPPSSVLGRIGDTMQPDFGGPVLAPLNYLFQECAALQGRRWLALLCNVIEDIRRFTFPNASDCGGGVVVVTMQNVCS